MKTLIRRQEKSEEAEAEAVPAGKKFDVLARCVLLLALGHVNEPLIKELIYAGFPELKK